MSPCPAVPVGQRRSGCQSHRDTLHRSPCKYSSSRSGRSRRSGRGRPRGVVPIRSTKAGGLLRGQQLPQQLARLRVQILGQPVVVEVLRKRPLRCCQPLAVTMWTSRHCSSRSSRRRCRGRPGGRPSSCPPGATDGYKEVGGRPAAAAAAGEAAKVGPSTQPDRRPQRARCVAACISNSLPISACGDTEHCRRRKRQRQQQQPAAAVGGPSSISRAATTAAAAQALLDTSG